MRTTRKIKQDFNYKLDLDFHSMKTEASVYMNQCVRTATQVRNSLRKKGIYISIARIEKACERFQDSQLFYTSLSDEDILSELNINVEC